MQFAVSTGDFCWDVQSTAAAAACRPSVVLVRSWLMHDTFTVNTLLLNGQWWCACSRSLMFYLWRMFQRVNAGSSKHKKLTCMQGYTRQQTRIIFTWTYNAYMQWYNRTPRRRNTIKDKQELVSNGLTTVTKSHLRSAAFLLISFLSRPQKKTIGISTCINCVQSILMLPVQALDWIGIPIHIHWSLNSELMWAG